MRKTTTWLTLILLLFGTNLYSEENEPSEKIGSLNKAFSDPIISGEKIKPFNFTYLDAVILGVVEGITEYLPISSTGHLIISNAILELDNEDPALDKSGNLIYSKEPSDENPNGIVMTNKEAIDAYSIMIQAGAIAAVFIIYWSKILSVILGFLGKNKNGLLLGRNLIVAFIPAVVLGLTLEDLIDTYLFDIWPVIVALIAGAFLMMGVEVWRKKKKIDYEGGPDLHELSIKQALVIGFLQCVAMWPGTSRSMMTIVGGFLVGLNPRHAAEFSFLLGLLTLGGASAYKAMKTGPEVIKLFGVGPGLLGCLVAAISAAIAVKWMVSYLTRHGLMVFAWYRLGLAIVVIIFIQFI